VTIPVSPALCSAHDGGTRSAQDASRCGLEPETVEIPMNLQEGAIGKPGISTFLDEIFVDFVFVSCTIPTGKYD